MSIRAKIIVLPVAVALLVTVLMGVGMFVSEQHALRIMHDRDLDTAQAWLEASINRTHKIALAQAVVIASLPVVQAAVAAQDDRALEQLLGPGFAHMKAAAGMAQMQFHLAPATSLVRIHKLEKRGDDLSGFRQTVVDANPTGTSLSGLERGRSGIGARGVAVVRHEGKPVGTVEVGLDVGVAFLGGLAARSGNHFEFYLMPDTDIETFDAANQVNTRLGATIESDPLLSGGDLAELRKTPTLDRDITLDGAAFAMRALAIRDYSGDVAGVVTLLRPIEAYGAISSKLAMSASIAALIAILLGTGVGAVTGHQLGQQFAEICRTTERLASGDPDLVITGTERHDEIGGISRALKLFHEKLQENARLEAALKEEEAAKRAHETAEKGAGRPTRRGATRRAGSRGATSARAVRGRGPRGPSRTGGHRGAGTRAAGGRGTARGGARGACQRQPLLSNHQGPARRLRHPSA